MDSIQDHKEKKAVSTSTSRGHIFYNRLSMGLTISRRERYYFFAVNRQKM